MSGNEKLFYVISKFFNSVFFHWSYYIVKKKEKSQKPSKRAMHGGLGHGEAMEDYEELRNHRGYSQS